ncbi:DUF6285 domain-containing protein [Mycobacterium sp. MYCO198283]|uniref:DUF6285 domain-containing protein n=1 Tax=Mycobacterium sp. MYCO198283 TaxID=2883505 RepID=UPI001E5B8AFC|nr:DUF6285 domain-containing protein [Mycobacterium sp. MYCO198283]MCG5431510.1 DUF6285 domain-containing protein [Mycobacterium sp. MYCO198283]
MTTPERPPIHGRPTAAELVAAVAEFLDTEVREHCTGAVAFHARVAANALRIVERELVAADAAAADDVATALGWLGYPDEPALAAAIRRGELDGRDKEVTDVLRILVGHRLAAAHPGYEHG